MISFCVNYYKPSVVLITEGKQNVYKISEPEMVRVTMKKKAFFKDVFYGKVKVI